MNIMDRAYGFFPAVGRTPGGADYPVAVDEAFPPLPPPADFTVGVIDTGIVLDAAHLPHPWFGDHVTFVAEEADQLAVGVGDPEEPGYLADADGHGTFVTGLILREAPTARVIMVGALDKTGGIRGDALGAEDDRLVAEAVARLAAEPGVQVINLSFAGGVFNDKLSAAKLEGALAEVDHSRIAVVAAAGNESNDQQVWPAAFDNVIAVGALDNRRLIPAGAMPPRAAFSNYGWWVKAYAEGFQVLGPFVEFEESGAHEHGLRPPQHFRGWARWSGTSFAAAIVSGRIAQLAIEQNLKGAEAAQALLDAAPKISIQDAKRGFDLGSAGRAIILGRAGAESSRSSRTCRSR